ncbi:hypothetical protein N7523_006134 [Penicillium sp. IBT 18751x]|nr:hypothetical protein N7523_006134 [Penicillium sp. IBT 18751x]
MAARMIALITQIVPVEVSGFRGIRCPCIPVKESIVISGIAVGLGPHLYANADDGVQKALPPIVRPQSSQ